MISIRKYRFSAFFGIVAAVVLAAGALTGCGDDDKNGGGGRNRVEWDITKTVLPDREGAAVLIVTGKEGTPWTAEIVSGEEWISFNRTAAGGQISKSGTVGTSLAAKNQYVYYWPNHTGGERHANIRFTFEGQAPIELTLTQYSPSGDEDVYATGRDKFWPEIPARLENNTSYIKVNNLMYVTHTAMMDGRNARNYTLCFDKTKYGAWWVAYPLPEKGYTGALPRPKPDPWAYDPKIEAQYQADLAEGSYNGSWDRGHQCPNADRNGNSTMQYQTFYCSNATPQVAKLNQGQWASLEDKVRDWKCPDTLYVVTGAVWQGGGQTTTDKSGKACPIPTHYFKVLLRTVGGNVRTAGDRLSDYPLKSIGFWVSNVSSPGAYKTWAASVSDIEQKTGFTFFPTVPESVKTQTETASWGL